MEKVFLTYQQKMKKKFTRKSSNNNDYATGNLLNFGYFKESYKLIAIDLSKQTKLKDAQQISIIGKLEKDDGVTMLFIIKKSEKTTFNFLENSVTVI